MSRLSRCVAGSLETCEAVAKAWCDGRDGGFRSSFALNAQCAFTGWPLEIRVRRSTVADLRAGRAFSGYG
jgi:hypothetical protein